MKRKWLAVGIILLFVGVCMPSTGSGYVHINVHNKTETSDTPCTDSTPSSSIDWWSTQTITSAPSDDDIEIRIYAGFFCYNAQTHPTGGKIGFGTTIHIINNRNESILVHQQYEYWTVYGKYLGAFRMKHVSPPNWTDIWSDFGWPWRLVYLKITVEAGDTVAQRTGFSFFNIVVLQEERENTQGIHIPSTTLFSSFL